MSPSTQKADPTSSHPACCKVRASCRLIPGAVRVPAVWGGTGAVQQPASCLTWPKTLSGSGNAFQCCMGRRQSGGGGLNSFGGRGGVKRMLKCKQGDMNQIWLVSGTVKLLLYGCSVPSCGLLLNHGVAFGLVPSVLLQSSCLLLCQLQRLHRRLLMRARVSTLSLSSL